MSDFVKLVGSEPRKKRGRPSRSYKNELEAMKEAHQLSSEWLVGALAVYAPIQVSILIWVGGGLLYRALESGRPREYVMTSIMGGLAFALLAITVPHVAAGVRHVTGFGRKNSFFLAVGIDCVAVGLEGMVKVGELDTFSIVVAVIGWAGSVFFSCFLNHEGFAYKRTELQGQGRA